MPDGNGRTVGEPFVRTEEVEIEASIVGANELG